MSEITAAIERYQADPSTRQALIDQLTHQTFPDPARYHRDAGQDDYYWDPDAYNQEGTFDEVNQAYYTGKLDKATYYEILGQINDRHRPDHGLRDAHSVQLLKYSEDQPRDESGKFAPGGGTSSSGGFDRTALPNVADAVTTDGHSLKTNIGTVEAGPNFKVPEGSTPEEITEFINQDADRDTQNLYDTEDHMRIMATNDGLPHAGQQFGSQEEAQAYANSLLSKYGGPAAEGATVGVVFADNPRSSETNFDSRVGGGKSGVTATDYLNHQQIELGTNMHDQDTVCHEMSHVIGRLSTASAENPLGYVGHGQSFQDTYKRIIQGEMPGFAANWDKSASFVGGGEAPPVLTKAGKRYQAVITSHGVVLEQCFPQDVSRETLVKAAINRARIRLLAKKKIAIRDETTEREGKKLAEGLVAIAKAMSVGTLKKANPKAQAKAVFSQGYAETIAQASQDAADAYAIPVASEADQALLVDSMTALELSFADGFFSDLTDGGGLSDAMIEARSDIYASSLTGAYEQAYSSTAIDGGYDVVTWVAQMDKRCCDICQARDETQATLDADGGMTWDDGAEGEPGQGDFGGDLCEGGPNCRCTTFNGTADNPDGTPGEYPSTYSGNTTDEARTNQGNWLAGGGVQDAEARDSSYRHS